MAKLNIQDVVAAARRAGFRGTGLRNIVAIAGRESSYDPSAKNLVGPDHSIGLTQINQLAHKGKYGSDAQLEDPDTNMRAAFALSGGGKNFQPWKMADGNPLSGTDVAAASRALRGFGSSTPAARAAAPAAATSTGTTGPDQTAALVSALTSGGKGSLLKRWQLALAQQPVAAAPSQESASSAASGTGAPVEQPSSGGGDTGLIARAKAVTARLDQANNAGKLPYLWGGGHGGKLSANALTPVDCSGAVSQVLGINPLVSGDLAKWGKPGEGRRITIYANGTHTFLKIDGKYWGTSRSNPGGGAGWIPSSSVNLSGFTVRHPDGA